MKINLKPNQKNTSRVSDALLAATKVNVTSEWRRQSRRTRQVFWSGGHYFNSRKALITHLIEETNDWLGANGLVDWNMLRHAKDSAGFEMFEITD